jgi:probable addiction module antidote protein
MPKRVTDYRKTLLESLADPIEAAHYLEAALDDSDEMFLIALRDVAESRQMAKVAEHAGVAREALYRMLRENGNPTYKSLASVLEAAGLRLSVVPIEGLQKRQSPSARSHEKIADAKHFSNGGNNSSSALWVRIRGNQVPQAFAAGNSSTSLRIGTQSVPSASKQYLAVNEHIANNCAIAQQPWTKGECAING